MKRITIGRQRKDGKFPVTYWYQGDENMFGGREWPTVFNKINSVDAIADHTLYEGDILENNSGKPDGYFWRS
jgi:hypothetical protein